MTTLTVDLLAASVEEAQRLSAIAPGDTITMRVVAVEHQSAPGAHTATLHLEMP